MKTQIFGAIAFLIALAYTDERVEEPLPEKITPEQVRIPTTKELIEKTTLHKKIYTIQKRQDSTSALINQTVKERTIDTVVLDSAKH